MEIGEIRVIALLFFDFFVPLSNFRFESQSDVIPTEVYDQFFDKSVRYYLFFKLPHLLLAFHHQMRDDCRRENEQMN